MGHFQGLKRSRGKHKVNIDFIFMISAIRIQFVSVSNFLNLVFQTTFSKIKRMSGPAYPHNKSISSVFDFTKSHFLTTFSKMKHIKRISMNIHGLENGLR